MDELNSKEINGFSFVSLFCKEILVALKMLKVLSRVQSIHINYKS